MKFNNAKQFKGVKGCRLHLVNTMEDWAILKEWLMTQPIFAADTETNGFHYYLSDRIVGMSFGWGLDHVYVPVRHEDSVYGGKQPFQLAMEDLRQDLRDIFARRNLTVVGHNFRFDMHFFKADGIEILCNIEDTMLKWVLYDENAPAALKVISSGWKDDLGRIHPGIVDLSANADEALLSAWRGTEASYRRKAFNTLVSDTAKEAAKEIEFQGWKLNDIKKVIKERLKDHKWHEAKKEDVHYGFVPIEDMTKYAALDTFLTYSVFEYLESTKKFQGKLLTLYKNEIDLTWALFRLEENGVKCNRKYLEDMSALHAKSIAEYEKKIYEVLGEINLNSPKQLLAALQAHGCEFTKKNRDKKKNKESESFSTDKKVLKKLARKHKVVEDILIYRGLDKIKNTYFDSILAKLTPDDYCHTSFNQNVRTGRMSSRSPNFTNIPRGNLVRDVFIAPSNEYYYLLADYSQIEIRITAHYSKDPLLITAYQNGQDVHTRTLSEVFGIPYAEAVAILEDENHPRYDEVNTLRTVCKIVNFGIIYGVGAPGLSEQIARPAKYANLSDEDWIDVCQGYIDAYLAKYVGVAKFVAKSSYMIKQMGFVDNYFGRRRNLPHVNACKITGDRTKFWMEQKAKRQGTNFLVQGCQDPTAPVLTIRGYIPINKLEEHGKPALITHTGIEDTYNVLDTGVKNCVRVHTSLSTGICSDEHKFYVFDEKFDDFTFKGINELRVGDYVCAKNIKKWKNYAKNSNLIKTNGKWHKFDLCPKLKEVVCAFIHASQDNRFSVKEKAAICMRSINKARLLDLLLRLDHSTQRDHYEQLLKNNFAQIRRIEEVGQMHTADLELFGDDHSYICRGLVQHNTSADLFKLALVRIDKLLQQHNAKSKLINNVHDEVQLYLHKKEAFLIPLIKHAMEDFKFEVPLVADFSYSTTSWGEKKKLKVPTA